MSQPAEESGVGKVLNQLGLTSSRPFPRKPVEEGSSTVYLDDSALKKPLELPRTQWLALGAIVLIAVLIGGIWGVRTIDGVLHYEQNQAAAVNKMIQRGTSLDMVHLTDYAGLNSEQMQQAMKDNGLQIIDVKSVVKNDANAIDIIKIPSDMSALEAAKGYAGGIDALAPAEAAKLLTGSWRLNQQASDGVDLHLHYADLSANAPDQAIARAIESQGFDAATVFDSGVDAKGNTYQIGKAETDNGSYQWTINVCPLNEVYNIVGFPITAQYVGIRLVLL